MVLRLHPSFFVAPEPFRPQPVTQLDSQPKSAEAAASASKTNEPQEGKQLKPARTALSVNDIKNLEMVKPSSLYWAPPGLRIAASTDMTPTSLKHANGHAFEQPRPMKTLPGRSIRDLVFRIGRNIDAVPRSLCIFRTTFEDQQLWERYLQYITQVIEDAGRAFNTTPEHKLHIHRTPLTLDKMEHRYFQGMPLSLVRSFFLSENIKAGPSVIEDHFIYVDEDTLETFRIYDAFHRRYLQHIQNVFESPPSGLSADHVTVYQVDGADRGIRDMAGRHLFTRGVVPNGYPTLRPSKNPVEERLNMERLRGQQPFVIFEALPEEEQWDCNEREEFAAVESLMDY